MPLHIFLTITVAFNIKVIMQSLYFNAEEVTEDSSDITKLTFFLGQTHQCKNKQAPTHAQIVTLRRVGQSSWKRPRLLVYRGQN